MDYILYGAVDLETNIIWRAIDYIEANSGNVICFVDDNEDKQQDNRYPRPIYGRSIIKKYPNAEIVILSSAIQEISNVLKNEDINNRIVAYPLFRYWFPCDDIDRVNSRIRSWTENNKEELLRIYENDDVITRKILDAVINQRMMSRFSFVDIETMFGFHFKEYFYDNALQPKSDELTIIDAGAFQGGSVKGLLELFRDRVKKVYAFEPDEDNIRIMRKNLENDPRIAFVEAGVSDSNGYFGFEQNHMSGHISDCGDVRVKLCKLDDNIDVVQGDLCITMDVEGFEAAAIRGAKELILEYKPYIIACVYHKMEDILEIPRIIREISDDYMFYLRAGTHTECYAIPKH